METLLGSSEGERLLMPPGFAVERREHKRLDLKALVITAFGTYLTRDVSSGGVSIVGPSELKEKLNINETIEFGIRTIFGGSFLRSVGMECRGKVVRISEPGPYVTEIGVKFSEINVLA